MAIVLVSVCIYFTDCKSLRDNNCTFNLCSFSHMRIHRDVIRLYFFFFFFFCLKKTFYRLIWFGNVVETETKIWTQKKDGKDEDFFFTKATQEFIRLKTNTNQMQSILSTIIYGFLVENVRKPCVSVSKIKKKKMKEKSVYVFFWSQIWSYIVFYVGGFAMSPLWFALFDSFRLSRCLLNLSLFRSFRFIYLFSLLFYVCVCVCPFLVNI